MSHTGLADYCLLANGSQAFLNSSSLCALQVANQAQLTCDGTHLRFQNAIIHSSDERIKADITTPSDADMWSALKTVSIRTYTKPYATDPTARRIGVVANELEAASSSGLLAGVVKTDPGPVRVAAGVELTDFKSVEYEQLYRMTLAVVQQLQTRVEALEAAAGQ